MSVPTIVQAKQVIDAGGIVCKVCPATSNLPTRLTAASWESLCKSTQAKEKRHSWDSKMLKREKSQIKRRYCGQVCKGQIKPHGLEIITAADIAAMKKQKQVNRMGSLKKKGTCEVCQRYSDSIGSNRGKLACPSCQSLIASVSHRPEAVAEAIRLCEKESQVLAMLGGSKRTVPVFVESEALKRIAAAIGYQGEDGEVLVKAVEAMAAAMPDCSSCSDSMGDQVAELQGEVERLRDTLESYGKYCTPDVVRALGCKSTDNAGLAAIQTAALLEYLEHLYDQSTSLLMFRNAEISEKSDELFSIKQALGLAEDLDPEVVLESIAAMTHAAERFRKLAESAEKRADGLSAENDRLQAALAEQNETLSSAIDPFKDTVAEFGLRVLRGEAFLGTSILGAR